MSITSSGLDQPAPSLQGTLDRAPANLQFLRSLYLDLAGRTPTAEEQKEAFGKSRSKVIGKLAGSLPFYEHFYEEELFYFLLLDNFRPSTDVFLRMPSDLNEKVVSVKDGLRALVSSQFFNARNPGNDTFVTVVLEQLLGMTVQKEVQTLEAGKKMYDGKPVKFLKEKGSSQSDLVRIVMQHEDFESFLLGRKFQEMFAAKMPAKRQRADAKRMQEDARAYPQVVAEWVSSSEYESLLQGTRPKNNRMFIRALFVDLLGRQANYQEYRRCRNALLALSDSGPLRSVLIKLILDSGTVMFEGFKPNEAAVSDLFLRFLCREPSAEELKTFVATGKRTGPSTLVRALLTHPEYHVY